MDGTGRKREVGSLLSSPWSSGGGVNPHSTIPTIFAAQKCRSKMHREERAESSRVVGFHRRLCRVKTLVHDSEIKPVTACATAVTANVREVHAVSFVL